MFLFRRRQPPPPPPPRAVAGRMGNTTAMKQHKQPSKQPRAVAAKAAADTDDSGSAAGAASGSGASSTPAVAAAAQGSTPAAPGSSASSASAAAAPAQGSTPAVAAQGVTFSKLLAFVSSHAWDDDPRLSTTKASMAVAILYSGNPRPQKGVSADAAHYKGLPGGIAAAMIRAALSLPMSAKVKLADVLKGDAYLRVLPEEASPQVTLDIAKLLRDAAAAQLPLAKAAAGRQKQQQAAAAVAAAKPQPKRLPHLNALPLPEQLQQLDAATPEACAAARVVVMRGGDSSGLGPLCSHVLQTRLVGVDAEFAAAPTDGNNSASGGSEVRQRGLERLALLQLFVPALTRAGAPQVPPTIYVLELPPRASNVAALLAPLRPLLEDDGGRVVKIMHDARGDSCVLRQQLGFELRGVLDTQLLAGLAGLAGAAAVVPPASASAAAVVGGGGGPRLRDLRRVGLGQLYQCFGFPHPHKEALTARFNSNPRLWLQRPLPEDAVAYAADDVRFLLPLARALLQQVPGALLALSAVQQRVAQEQVAAGAGDFRTRGPSPLVLRRRLLAGYAPLLDGGGGGSATAADGAGLAADVPPGAAGLVQLAFELTHHRVRGWVQARYGVYLAEAAGGDGSSASARQQEEEAAASGLPADAAVDSMAQVLPPKLRPHLAPYAAAGRPATTPQLLEVVIDAGERVSLRLSDHSRVELPDDARVTVREVLAALAAARRSWAQQGLLRQQEEAVAVDDDAPAGDNDDGGGDAGARVPFGSDNRTGVPGTLHRISAMRDRSNRVVGLTARVGRHVPGGASALADVLSALKVSLRSPASARRGAPSSLLLLGPPGTGKTTLLRDIAALASTPPSEGGLGLSVVVVDTSNEIAGDAESRHPCIGRARRMMVRHRDAQADVMVEAVQNHTPEVIIVDEIGTRREAAAARTIAQRGVVLIATAHARSLAEVLRNPELSPLVGGVTNVTLGDAAAAAADDDGPPGGGGGGGGGRRFQKTRQERAGAATFTALVELQRRDEWRLHLGTEASVDAALAGGRPDTQLRVRLRGGGDGQRQLVVFESPGAAEQALKLHKLVGGAALAEASEEAAAAAAAAPGGGGGSSSTSGGIVAAPLLPADPLQRVVAEAAAADRAAAAWRAGGRGGGDGFGGAWLVDLLHASVHAAVVGAAGGDGGGGMAQRQQQQQQ